MNSNFNFSDVPGELLYRNRRYLDEFGVEEPASLNAFIHDWLYNHYAGYDGYEEFATSMFNCAYRICTRAIAESHPDRRLGSYIKEAEVCMHHVDNYTCVVLSIVLLQTRCHRWDITPQMTRLAKALEDKLKTDKYHDVYIDFYESVHRKVWQINAIKGISLQPFDHFCPRKITYQLLCDVKPQISWTEYFGNDPDKIEDFVNALGKNDEERHIITRFLHDELYTDSADDMEQTDTIDETETEIETEPEPEAEADIEEPVDELFNKVHYEFLLRLFEHAGFDINDTGNKTRISQFMHQITGKSVNEIRKYCSTRNYFNNHTRAQVEWLDRELASLGINIRLLPDKLSQK